METRIDAPPEVCFDLARDLGVHRNSLARTGERIVGDKQNGLLELDEEVTFEGRHFGVRQRLASRIVEFDRPHEFVDQMTKGAFKRLIHWHRFEAQGANTLMVDELEFEAPLGVLGRVIERCLLAGYMKRLLEERGLDIKRIAEARSQR